MLLWQQVLMYSLQQRGVHCIFAFTITFDYYYSLAYIFLCWSQSHKNMKWIRDLVDKAPFKIEAAVGRLVIFKIVVKVCGSKDKEGKPVVSRTKDVQSFDVLLTYGEACKGARHFSQMIQTAGVTNSDARWLHDFQGKFVCEL